MREAIRRRDNMVSRSPPIRRARWPRVPMDIAVKLVRRERLVPAEIKFELIDGVIRPKWVPGECARHLNVPLYRHILVQ